MASIASAWRSFWHTMTSQDRHASHDSPYRTGGHVALPQNRHTPLSSVATNATDSHVNLPGTQAQTIHENGSGYFGNGNLPGSPSSGTPYSPGMRSFMQRKNSADVAKDPTNIGEVQMQNFSDGLPPPPPVGHSWKRIDRWAGDNYEELLDNLSEGCTQNDINELEHELDCTLPMEVRESLQVHDGQERGGLPTGIIFGCMLLDCEEIVQEWKNWRTVNEELLSKPTVVETSIPPKAFAAAESSTAPNVPVASPVNSSAWRDDLLSRQDSQPSNTIQKAYAHPAWIPLARDWGGNCLAVDLAPGPAGKWGQVIIMGRDFDCKYAVARSWAAFLGQFADDLCSPKSFVVEDSGELKLREFPNQPGVEPPYLNILRWRTDQKYGRKSQGKRRTTGGETRVNTNAPPGKRPSPHGSPRVSPYGSPVISPAEPMRNPHRLSGSGGKGASNGPRAPVSSPLARVAEEGPASINTEVSSPIRKGSFPKPDKLVPVDTPVAEHSSGANGFPALNESSPGALGLVQQSPLSMNSPALMNSKKENVPPRTSVDSKAKDFAATGRTSADDDMKEVEI